MIKTGGKNILNAVAGDILCAKEDGSKAVFDAEDYDSIPSSWTPIGVVVIPPSHDVYGTGEGAAVALNWVTRMWGYDTGDTTISMLEYGYVSSSIPDYWATNKIKNTDPPTLFNRISSGGDIPSNIFNNISGKYQCLHDPDTYYIVSSFSESYCPSPYLSDGSRNSLYYEIPYENYKNALSDFDGLNHTIIHKDDGMSYGTTLCSRYYSIGTNPGDWYIPAVGEIGYLAVRMKSINDSLNNLKTIYSNVCDLSVNPGTIGGTMDYKIWTSTEREYDEDTDEAKVWALGLNLCQFRDYTNYEYNGVRAFTRF